MNPVNPPPDGGHVWAGRFEPGVFAGRAGLGWWSWLGGGFFGLFELVEGDGVAERFELTLEAPGAVLWAVALALPVGSSSL